MNPPGPVFRMSDSHCPEYLIAFDCSSTAIGYGYFAHNRLVDCGSVRSSKPTVQARIVDLMAKIAECFQQPIPKDVVCVMEWSCGRPMAFLKDKGRSAQSSVPLAHAQGAFFFWLMNQGLDVVCVGENQWTKRGGKYVSKVNRAAEVVLRYPDFRKVWKEDGVKDRWDAADAVGLGDWYIGQMLGKDAYFEGKSLQARIPKGER